MILISQILPHFIPLKYHNDMPCHRGPPSPVRRSSRSRGRSEGRDRNDRATGATGATGDGGVEAGGWVNRENEV